MSHFSLPTAYKCCGTSASTSLSESLMTLGSLPASEASPQADPGNTADDGLDEHFVVKFQLQVLNFRRLRAVIFLGAVRFAFDFSITWQWSIYIFTAFSYPQTLCAQCNTCFTLVTLLKSIEISLSDVRKECLIYNDVGGVAAL